jgi:alpha 1,2-mannosyltransferase
VLDCFTQVAIHFILTFSHEDYSRATSLDSIRIGLGHVKPNVKPPYKTTPRPDSIVWDESTGSNRTRRANAAFVVLARNGDLRGIISSMKQMEDRFNKKYNYPWIFLNEEPFTDNFKK